MMTRRIAIVTAGGPISAFHAGMLGMHDSIQKKRASYELVGAKGGLAGLQIGNLVPIVREHLDQNRAGSSIGADRNVIEPRKIKEVVRRHGIDAIIMMGGDNHLLEAQRCFEAGVNIVGWPKTMDNDLTSFASVGWHTAVTVGAMRTREHHNGAITSGRVFYVGLFGRDTDGVVCGVTAYGCGDLAIPAEREYEWDHVFEMIRASAKANLERYGVGFAVVPYSEGARIKGINGVLSHQVDAHENVKLSAELIGMRLVELTKTAGMDAAFQAHTHSMRDGPPTYVDIQLAKMAGEECINMILDRDFGKAVVFEPNGTQSNGKLVSIARAPLCEAAKKRKVSGTGLFNYDTLNVEPAFVDAYGNLFRNPLGRPPSKDDMVYRNMRPQ